MTANTYQDAIAAAQVYERYALIAAASAARNEHNDQWHAIMMECAEAHARRMAHLYEVARCIASGKMPREAQS